MTRTCNASLLLFSSRPLSSRRCSSLVRRLVLQRFPGACLHSVARYAKFIQVKNHFSEMKRGVRMSRHEKEEQDALSERGSDL